MKQITRIGSVYKPGEPIFWKRKGGAFSPLDLFASGEEGAWYDPSDFSTMFQDSAGTTPVTAVGQTVGKILDKSGRGNHATQATEASRPVLQQDGNGKYYLGFDGVDDSLSTGNVAFNGLTGASFVGARQNSGSGGWINLWMTAQPGGGWWRGSGSGSGSSPTGSACGTPTYYTNGIIVSQQTQGGLFTSESLLNTVQTSRDVKFGNATDTGLSIAGYSGFMSNMNLYAVIILGRTPTTQEITDTETWVNEKTGAY